MPFKELCSMKKLPFQAVCLEIGVAITDIYLSACLYLFSAIFRNVAVMAYAFR